MSELPWICQGWIFTHSAQLSAQRQWGSVLNTTGTGGDLLGAHWDGAGPAACALGLGKPEYLPTSGLGLGRPNSKVLAGPAG